MPQIIFLPNAEHCPDGAVFQAEAGETVLNAALRNGIHIEHACEKSCACTTCHVVIREGLGSLEPSDELEDDMLDKAWNLTRAYPARQLSRAQIWWWRFPAIRLIRFPRVTS